jgi:YjbE family integral membrane protein
MQPVFWLGLSKVVWIDILLSGDNALVIAMACRGLDRAALLGHGPSGAGAVALRIACTGVIATLLEYPYLKIVGGLALLYVATKLLLPERKAETDIKANRRLWAAIRMVMIADIVMSLDNVIAVAAAANGSLLLLVIGLA